MLLNDTVSLRKYITVAIELDSAEEWLTGNSDNIRQVNNHK